MIITFVYLLYQNFCYKRLRNCSFANKGGLIVVGRWAASKGRFRGPPALQKHFHEREGLKARRRNDFVETFRVEGGKPVVFPFGQLVALRPLLDAGRP